jgi:hypothetical protein
LYAAGEQVGSSQRGKLLGGQVPQEQGDATTQLDRRSFGRNLNTWA